MKKNPSNVTVRLLQSKKRLVVGFMFLSVVAATVFASETPGIDLAGSYGSASDERVIAEVHFTLEADTMPTKQEGTLYFLPIALATKEEKARNRAFAQSATITSEKPFAAWGYSLGIWPRAQSFEVEIFTDKWVSDSVQVEREASFSVDRFADIRIEKAGIRLTLTWKRKPSQTPGQTLGRAASFER